MVYTHRLKYLRSFPWSQPVSQPVSRSRHEASPVIMQRRCFIAFIGYYLCGYRLYYLYRILSFKELVPIHKFEGTTWINPLIKDFALSSYPGTLLCKSAFRPIWLLEALSFASPVGQTFYIGILTQCSSMKLVKFIFRIFVILFKVTIIGPLSE